MLLFELHQTHNRDIAKFRAAVAVRNDKQDI
jgi:hypothetical protein